jgi:hypothetical protein
VEAEALPAIGDTVRMKVAYLVLTHGMPDHLGRLITALRDEGVSFFVHVDRKVPIEPFLAYRALDVEFLDERVPVYWGEWQMVEATLRLMKRALEQADPDYLVLLSGSCYPIRSNSRIRSLLGDGTGQFINSVPMPSEELHKPISRIERFRFRSDRPWIENVIRAVPVVLHGPRRGRRFSRRWLLTRDWRRELRLDPYAGSSWWALTGTAARYVLDFAAREPSVVRFFENTRSPDEGFFQTVLANSTFGPAMRRGLTYSDWKQHGSHPAVITTEHVESFARPGPLMGRGIYGTGELCFARKFPDDGGAMTGLVDAVIRTHDEALPTAG